MPAGGNIFYQASRQRHNQTKSLDCCCKSTAIKVNYCPEHEAPFRRSSQWRIKRGRKTHSMQLRGANDHYKTGCRCSPRRHFCVCKWIRFACTARVYVCIYTRAQISSQSAAESRCAVREIRRKISHLICGAAPLLL